MYCALYNRQLFGEGLNWAGCTMIALLKQQLRFESLDFCYHLLRVQRADEKDETVKNCISVKRMCERIRRFQILNGQIFATLQKTISSGDSNHPVVEHVVRVFEPPLYNPGGVMPGGGGGGASSYHQSMSAASGSIGESASSSAMPPGSHYHRPADLRNG